MSVIVKGIEMPRNCLECIFKDIGMSMMTKCFLQKEWVKYKNDSHIPQQCPLIEIPKDARLIDGKELKKNILKWMPPDPCGVEEKEFPFETDICVSTLMEIDEAPIIFEEEEK